MVIHLETKIVTIFGVLDDNGNVVQRFAVQPGNEPNDPLNIAVLNQDSFVNAFNAISGAKAELVKKLEEAKAAQVATDEKKVEQAE